MPSRRHIKPAPSQFSIMRLFLIALICCTLLTNSTGASIIYETGSLRGFLGSSCPNCAYDNWISHISEAIANPHLNDFGPVELDPQTNGFGSYQRIEQDSAGNALIASWYYIFTQLFAGDTATVASELTATSLDTIYQLVVLTDAEKEYYILRELLNMDYYDDQLTPDDTTDDVQGSFDLGWGVYVFSPSAAKPNIIVEMPHPTDDYISPFVGIDVFESYDAGLLMIAGAGREVLWTNEGEYNNSKSLSDPTRNSQTVFHAAHRAFVDNQQNHFTLQVHSFDTILHQGLRSVVLSAGPDDAFPNEPILDRCAYDDMISLTPYIAVPEQTCGTHPDVLIEHYYQLYYEGGYAYQGETPEIPINNELPGYSQNKQIIYSHTGHDADYDPENFLHIEMDEFPDLIEDTITVFYLTDLPGVATFDNFTNAIEYYKPAYLALELALEEPPMANLISPDPSLLLFPQIPVNESDTMTVYFTNISISDTLFVQNASTNSDIFTVVSAPENDTLHPAAQCSVIVAFCPQQAFNYQQKLTLSTGEGCSYVPMIGGGLGSQAALMPPFWNFGPVGVDKSDSIKVYLRNLGNYPMHLLSLVDSPPHFLFREPSDSTIPPGAQSSFNLVFYPLQDGLFADTLWVISDAVLYDTLAFPVQGEGGFHPAAPEHLIISREGPEVFLSWEEVTKTIYGTPVHIEGYAIYFADSLSDSFQLKERIPEIEFTFPLENPEIPRQFYQIRAYGDCPE